MRTEACRVQVRATNEGGEKWVEQCPLSPFRLTCIVTRTNSSFATAGTLCDILALPEPLADALGAMDHERPSAVSVPITSACGFVDTLITTTL